jgi:hypothetical protein
MHVAIERVLTEVPAEDAPSSGLVMVMDELAQRELMPV